MPASRAPALRAVCVQPSKGTWGSVAFSTASRWASRSMPSTLRQRRGLFAADPGGALRRAMAQLLAEHEHRHVGHALWIEDAVEVVAFVLDDAGVEAVRVALDLLALQPVAAVADVGPARNRAGEARHRQAGLPAELVLVAQRLDHGIDQDGQGYALRPCGAVAVAC